MKGWTVIGLMSGTSVDGIDAAILETDGTDFVRTGVAGFYPYQRATCDAIWRAVADPIAHMEDTRPRQNLDRMIASDHAAAVDALRAKTALTIDLIGFHGQTIFHDPTRTDGAGRPHPFATIQLGDAAHLANLTGIDVVFDVSNITWRKVSSILKALHPLQKTATNKPKTPIVAIKKKHIRFVVLLLIIGLSLIILDAVSVP